MSFRQAQTVEEALSTQRKNINFSVDNLSKFLYGNAWHDDIMKAFEDPYVHPIDFNIYNLSRVELIKQAYYALPGMIKNVLECGNTFDVSLIQLLMGFPVQLPGTVHASMFCNCIQFLGSQEQKKIYLNPENGLEIFGCYAQTQLGHGSDVRSLETTATFDERTQQFIINSPTISSTKYWPGDMGISATHALVFAQMILKGQSYGVHPFLVQIRDRQYNVKPNVEVGDIGPKIGFHTKDNGYLRFDNVRITKKNLVNKFVEIDQQANLTMKGDPKVSYAAMMIIRTHIAFAYPKIYSQPITYAVRYSLFRKQFKNSHGQQIKIMDYQLQQQKLIPRIVEFYAITIAGNKIKSLAQQNFRKVLEENDSSLMAETHNCLCLGKTFFTQLIVSGMEVCRKACGGHGYSQYSGFPSTYHEYIVNVTQEGQNTVLYLQLARNIMKNYSNFKKDKQPLSNSFKYIESLDFLLKKKIKIADQHSITIQDLRVLFSQTACFLIKSVNQITQQYAEKLTKRQVWDEKVGIRLVNLAIAHACHYMFECFGQAIIQQKNEDIRFVLGKMCLLFGVNLILTNTSTFIQGEFITPEQLSSLKLLKQNLLRQLRPVVIGLIDAFKLPQKFIRSELAYGNPYQNFLKQARKCQINQKISQAGLYVKNNIPKVLAGKL